MGKTPNMKYETPKDPAKAGPTGQGETPKDPAKAGPTGQGETPKDPAKAGPTGQGETPKDKLRLPTGQGERERERVIRAPQFLNFSKFIYFLIFPITLGRFLFLAN